MVEGEPGLNRMGSRYGFGGVRSDINLFFTSQHLFRELFMSDSKEINVGVSACKSREAVAAIASCHQMAYVS